MQTITPELAAILKDKFQAGVDGFRGRVDVLTGPGAPFSVIPTAIRVDKSLRLDGDQAEFDVPNEGDVFGWGPDSVFKTNARVRFFQWYGDEANEVRTFTGLLDKVHDHRDAWGVTVTCRDMMALLLDQTFSAIGPQTSDETGHIRTEANGVYLNKEVSYIVNDILDRAGWPEDDRLVDVTSNVVEEFIVNDGDSWAETIIGEDKLTALTGYDAWADELGVFHFSLVGFASVSDDTDAPPDPTYVFRSGEDITALDDETDQYDLRTRVKVRGPQVTTTLKDAWTLLWKTTKIRLPVGFWYDPSDSAAIRVLDRGTKRIYRMRQSDRVILSSVYVGGVCPRPLGLSGDSGDSAAYWVLNAPWRTGGGTSGNFIKKIRRSDNHVLKTFALPNGRWTDMKVSSNWIWLTNYDDDKIHRYNKSTGASSASYTITYASVAQTNPTGIMVDGSTLFYFFANGGSTARFLKASESAPGTITGVIKTAGTILKGGEMDTTTHVNCYGGSDDLGITAKFTLLQPVSTSKDVSVEVIDTDLEDELGALAETEDRVHDSHSGDAAHPYEVRRETMNLKLITSLAQAADAARILLAKIGKRRRVLDAGIVGNPPLQKGDLVGVLDPPTGISTLFFVDTYRTDMTDGAYLGTVALLPLRDVTFVSDDAPTDDGGATDTSCSTIVNQESFDTTLGFTPTAGNLLLLVTAVRGQAAALTDVDENGSPGGWTIIHSGEGYAVPVDIAAKISDGTENTRTLIPNCGGNQTEGMIYEIGGAAIADIGSLAIYTATPNGPGIWGPGAIPNTGFGGELLFCIWGNDTDAQGDGYKLSSLTGGWSSDFRSPSNTSHDNPQTLIAHAIGGPDSPDVDYWRLGHAFFPTDVIAIGFSVNCS